MNIMGIENDMSIEDRQHLNNILLVLVIFISTATVGLLLMFFLSIIATGPFLLLFLYLLARNNRIGLEQERGKFINEEHEKTWEQKMQEAKVKM